MEWEYMSVGKEWIVDSKHDGNSITDFLNKASTWRGGRWELVSQRLVYKEDVLLYDGFYTSGKPVPSGKFKGAWVSHVDWYNVGTNGKVYGQRQSLSFLFKRPKK